MPTAETFERRHGYLPVTREGTRYKMISNASEGSPGILLKLLTLYGTQLSSDEEHIESRLYNL